MIYLPFEDIKGLSMPIDKAEIITDIGMKPDFIEWYEDFRHRDVGQPRNYGNGLDGTGNQDITVPLVPFSLVLKLWRERPGAHPRLTGIQLNPSGFLYTHNGYLTDTFDVVLALSQIRESIRPMLANPGDDVLLIPGLQKGGPSYWKSLELAAHLLDPDGELLLAFRNARHPSIRKEPFGYHGESLKIKACRGEVGFSAYRKDVEMRKLLIKTDAPEQQPILRVELLLSGGKLVDYLGNPGNLEEIDGQLRLVRYTPSDILSAHQRAIHELRGTFYKSSDKTGKKYPRFIALVSKLHKVPLPELFAAYAQAAAPKPRVMQTLKRETYRAASALSELRVEDIFTPDAYSTSRSIYIPQADESYSLIRDFGPIYPSIRAAYGPPEPEAETAARGQREQ